MLKRFDEFTRGASRCSQSVIGEAQRLQEIGAFDQGVDGVGGLAHAFRRGIGNGLQKQRNNETVNSSSVTKRRLRCCRTSASS